MLDSNGASVLVAGLGHETGVHDVLHAGANEAVIRVCTNLHNRCVPDQPAHCFGLGGFVALLVGE